MQKAFEKTEEFAAHLEEYVNNRITAAKLAVAAKSSKLLSNVIALAVVTAIMLLFALFISMAASFALSELLGPMYSGFLIMGGTWLLLAVIIWFSREKLLRLPLMNRMLHEMLRYEEDK